MTPRALTTIWSFFAFNLLSFSLLFFLRERGMDPDGDIFGIIKYGPTTIAALALPVDLALMSIFLTLSLMWSRQVGGATWVERQPIFFFDKDQIILKSPGGKFYQGLTLFLTLIVPFALTLRMAQAFFDGAVFLSCECHKPEKEKVCGLFCSVPRLVSSWEEHFSYAKLADAGSKGMLKFGEIEGPEYFAVLPWAYSAWLAVVLLVWLFAIWSIVFGAPVEKRANDEVTA